jgi:hypothetical protein
MAYWYYRAGAGYQKAKRFHDTNAIARRLAGVAAKFPAVCRTEN